MNAIITTKRLILREIAEEDQHGIFALDSDPEVLRYLNLPLMKNLQEAQKVVHYIQKQYKENGIGRWAMILRENNEFIGWCGIKLMNDHVLNNRTNYYDIGYRLLAKRWGAGYATEAAEACIEYAFDEMKLKEIHGTAMFGNFASARVLEKLGMERIEDFVDENGKNWHWYTLESSRRIKDVQI